MESELALDDVVLVSGIHIQRNPILDITRRAHRAGKVVAFGELAVTVAPENYEGINLLDCGEVGDGTLELFRRINETSARPQR